MTKSVRHFFTYVHAVDKYIHSEKLIGVQKIATVFKLHTSYPHFIVWIWQLVQAVVSW